MIKHNRIKYQLVFSRYSRSDRAEASIETVSSIVDSLKRCISSRDILTGKKIHSQVMNSGLRDIFVESTLVDLYAKCGNMVLSRDVFDNMAQRNAVSWNCLIHGYVENGEPELALELFCTMQKLESSGCAPTCRTYAAALSACTHLGSRRDVQSSEWLARGKDVYIAAVRNKCCDRFVKTMAINMYAKCGSMAEARCLFDELTHPTVVSWTALIQGYAENGESLLALELFERMVDEKQDGCQPNARTFLAALGACNSLVAGEAKDQNSKWLEKAENIYSRAAATRCCDIFVENTLVSLYASCARMEKARGLFDKMPKHNIVSWNALLQGYVDNGDYELALDMFNRLETGDSFVPDARSYVAAIRACSSLAFEEDVKPGEPSRWLSKGKCLHSRSVDSRCCNTFVENALIDMYSKCRSMVDSRRVFDTMARRDLVTWNSLLRGYVHNGENQEVLKMISLMKSSGFAPDANTYVAALMACGYMAAADAGSELHAEIKAQKLEQHLAVATCLVEFYGRCGSMEAAKKVFDSIPSKDVWAWNALMSGYSLQGDTTEAIQQFHLMTDRELISPNAATFTSLLGACSHAGLIEQSMEYLQMMEREYGVKPDLIHYTCVVDALGRANRLEEAMEFVTQRMPSRPTLTTWTSILAACSKWKNLDLGSEVSESLLKSSIQNAAAYSLMANLYSNYKNSET